MYNLIVSADESSFGGEPFILDLSRCVREYTDNNIMNLYSSFKQNQINDIRRFPTIFCYERGIRHNPKFGYIKDLTIRTTKVRIEYELVSLESFINYEQLEEMSFELDITGWELNRTHWAIKDVNLSKELYRKNIKLPDWVRDESKRVDITKHKFDVAFSFPGEDREYVKDIAQELEKYIGPNSYFYDNNYKAQLARPSLDLLLQDIYRNRAKLIIVFLSSKYQEKDWCGIEFKAVREIIMGRQNDKVMYIRMDNGDVDGVFRTDGYIDAKQHTIPEIAKYIVERVELLAK
jgi:hypothetical protein